MERLEIVWHETEIALNRWRYVVATLLNEALDSSGFDVHHLEGMAQLPSDAEEAVVIVHGEHELNLVGQIVSDLDQLKRAIVVVVADECGIFPTRQLRAPNRKVWQQYIVPGHQDWVSHGLTCAYPIAIKEFLYLRRENRPLDWFFSGQLTHLRRHMCVNQLQQIPNGLLNTTAGFWQGWGHDKYYEAMGAAKIVPCPSGPATPDSIRVFEALEMGCVPIVDGLCPRRDFPSGYWDYVLKQPAPFPVIENWNDLPRMMEEELQKWPANRDRLQEWFKSYKQEMATWVRRDLEELKNS